MVFVKLHTQQRCGSGFGTLLEAVGEGGLSGFRGSSTWFLQGWPRLRRWRGAGWAAAPGQSNWDVAAALAGSAQSRRTWESPCQDLHSKRSTMCARHTSTQPQGNFAAASRFASAVHRPAHGVRGKVDQTIELVSHDGVEAQAIRRSSHTRPHGGSAAGTVPASKAACAAVGERARCALLLGLPRQSLRPSSLGALHHGGSSQRAVAVGGLLATRFGQVLRARRAREKAAKPGSPHDFWLVGALRTKAGVSSRPTSAPLFLSGPLDHSSRLQ